MGLSKAFYDFWTGYIDFEGRSPRSELWWNILIFLIVIPASISYVEKFVAMITDGLLGIPFTALLFALIKYAYILIMIIPIISLSCRRYHDVGYHKSWVMPIVIVSLIIILASCLVVGHMQMTPWWWSIITLITLIGNIAVGLMPTNYRSR